MGKINQLSFAVANLIAAGEVVDRPASVVKELLENSIDAGADSIHVEINRGGVSLIRVCDNGCGISKEDLPLSIKRHATSKISKADDLESIMTLGFRGEALAAISSVADVRILSKTHDAELGHLLSSSASGEVDVCEVGCADGTTVIVENLFSNVPARRKFLKKDVTESIAVTAVVEKIALSRPDISFDYFVDGQRRFSTAGDGKIKNAVYAVLGRDFASRLVEVDSEYDGIKISGFIGRSDNCRANRNMQNFFINGRYVKSKTAAAAIEQAYTSYIAEGKFPVCVMFIDISPAAVDVNVHPAKLEVKFSDEKRVFESVYYSVKSALENHTKKAEFDLPGRADFQAKKYETYSFSNRSNTVQIPQKQPTFRPSTNSFVPIEERKPTYQSAKTTLLDYDGAFRLKNTDADTVGFHIPEKNALQTENASSEISQNSSGSIAIEDTAKRDSLYETLSEEVKAEIQTAPNKALVKESEIENSYESSVSSYRLIGICFDTYILVEQQGKLLIIDKHAAHERIIFEQLKKNLKKIEHASQMLLIPINIKLSSGEYSSALEFKSEITETGFEFSLDPSDMSVHIEAIPDMLDLEQAQDVFVTALDNLANNRASAALTRDAVYEKALYQSACKAAVKGGRHDNDDNIRWICDTLMSIPDIKVCPHGRPVVTELDKRYIDRQFERIK